MYNIAIFLGELRLDTQRKVFEGIVWSAKADGNNVVAYSFTLTGDDSFNKGETEVAVRDDLSGYDAFIIYAGSMYDYSVRSAIVEKVQGYDKPCASIDYYIPGMINVSSNGDRSMQELISHIINYHGCKMINYIGGPENSINAQIRKHILISEMKEAGLIIDPNRFYTGDFYASSGRDAVDYFAKMNTIKADAYICANDQMALGALDALGDRGYKVPDDILMTGYDNIFEAANHYPRITSVNRYEEKTGEAAYTNLINLLEGKVYTESPVVNTNVIFAESCGCDAVRPIPHRVVVNNYVKKQMQENRYAKVLELMTANLTDVAGYEELCERLKDYLPLIDSDFVLLSLVNPLDVTGKARIGICYENGEFTQFAVTADEERSGLFTKAVGGNSYVICSLHFSDKYFGHILIRNSKMPLESFFFKIFVTNLSDTIEHINNYIKMQSMIKDLDAMCVFDPMTQVYNRNGFFRYANKVFDSARFNRENMFFIFLDIDGLKNVNDEYGHDFGDRLICDIADVLRKCRDKEHILMRYGGDEFVLFGTIHGEEHVEKLVESVRGYMQEINNKNDRPYRLEASIGYHFVYYDTDTSLEELIKAADQQMYIEKRRKHNT